MWLLNGVQFTDEMICDYNGFVYLITNLQTGRMYIGQKNFWVPKTKMVNKKKKKYKAISDYKDYFGSNEELKQHVIEAGPENFKREILHLCPNKGTQNYLELREQIDRRVMESDLFYNAFVGGKIHKKHIKL